MSSASVPVSSESPSLPATDARYVLYTEDNPTDAVFFRRAFTKVAADVPLYHFDNGSDAWRFLDERVQSGHSLPLLCLFDIKMPGYSGLELLELMRGTPALRFSPTVLLSASYETSDINRAYEYRANAYLVKPNRYRELSQLVESLSIFWLQYNRTSSS